MAIAVHVLGPGYGESIILELPDGTIGVIDSFLIGKAGQRHCPPLDLIRGQFADRPLTFLAITHPHADHCRGASAIARALPPEQLWLFETYDFDFLRRFFNVLYEGGRRDATEIDVEAESGSIDFELLKLRDLADDHCVTKLLRPDERFELCGGQVGITFLTPEHSAVKRYRRSLRRNLEALVSDAGEGPILDPAWQPRDLDHNHVSGAILVDYGATRLLFLADAVGPLWTGWDDRLKERRFAGFPPVSLVKASHHGSTNGFHDPLFRSALRGGKTLVVVTPFDRQRSALPSRDGTDLLCAGAREVLCTNWPKACLSSERLWFPYEDYPAGLPAEVIGDLARLWRLRRQLGELDSDTGPERYMALFSAMKKVGPFGRIRLESEQRDRVEDEFRVGLYFDDQGNEQGRRYRGKWVGRLHNVCSPASE